MRTPSCHASYDRSGPLVTAILAPGAARLIRERSEPSGAGEGSLGGCRFSLLPVDQPMMERLGVPAAGEPAGQLHRDRRRDDGGVADRIGSRLVFPSQPVRLPGMLVVVQAQFEVDWARPEWIEDELIRCGAREAHLVDEYTVAVTVAARSRPMAEELVHDLLDRVGASVVGGGGGILV